MGKDLAEECVDAKWIGLAHLNAKGNDLVPSELDATVKNGLLHQVFFVNLFQWLDVDDAINLLPADRFL